ncbi:hypothetical protein EJD97_012617, partial [Solanum chilense]
WQAGGGGLICKNFHPLLPVSIIFIFLLSSNGHYDPFPLILLFLSPSSNTISAQYLFGQEKLGLVAVLSFKHV